MTTDFADRGTRHVVALLALVLLVLAAQLHAPVAAGAARGHGPGATGTVVGRGASASGAAATPAGTGRVRAVAAGTVAGFGWNGYGPAHRPPASPT